MTMTRSAKRAGSERGSVEARSPNADVGRWIIWGTGEAPEIQDARPGPDVAMEMARESDPRWWDRPDRWIVIVDGGESRADELVADLPEARGYAPYLAAGRDEEAPDAPMRGTLRSDVAPRRKAEPR